MNQILVLIVRYSDRSRSTSVVITYDVACSKGSKIVHGSFDTRQNVIQTSVKYFKEFFE